MQDKYKKIIKIVLAIVVILVGMFLAWFLISEPQVNNVNIGSPIINSAIPAPVVNTNTPIKNTESAIVNNIVPAAPINAGERAVLAVASSFAERFGSYSNDGGYENIDDLILTMTSELQVWARNLIKQRETEKVTEFYGIKTKALSNRVKSLDDNNGTVLVSTQRQEIKGNTLAPKVFNQDAEVKIKKVDGKWLVSGIYWK